MDNATATAKNTNIVSGGSDEAVALSKQAAQEQVGNIMQQAAVQGAQTKENVWNTADSQIDQMTNYIATAKRRRLFLQHRGLQMPLVHWLELQVNCQFKEGGNYGIYIR